MMKKTLHTLLAFFISFSAFSQTNTFPTTGNVGIGTSNPQVAPLHILANNNLVQLRLERTGTSPGISSDIGGFGGNLFFYPGGYFVKTGNVIFDTSGKLGVGTSTPEDKVHIFSPGTNGTRETSLLIDGYAQSTLVDGSSQVIRFKGNAERHWGAVGGYTANGKEGMGIFAGTATSLTTAPGLYLNSDQNVGIGTTSPNEKLSVYGQNVSFLSGTPYNQLRIGRNLNENFRFYVGDNDAFLDYNQDSDANTKHIFRIRNVAEGTSQDNDIRFSTGGTENLTIKGNGNVGIGTISPTEKLSVDGNILAKRVRVSVDAADWPDYVFANGYKPMAISKLEQYIQQNGHLPEVPSAQEVEENGLDLGSMDANLLKKVEELTLYLIEQNKRLDSLEKENKELKQEIKTLKK